MASNPHKNMTPAQHARAIFTAQTVRATLKTASIPKELTELDQWVLWRYEADTKRPYSAKTKKLGSSTNPADWAPFDDVMAVYDKHPERWTGIGFVFAEDDNLCGIDLDNCILPGGQMKPWASQIIERMQSYAEISPSGKGIKIFTQAKLPGAGIKRYLLTDGTITTEQRHPNEDGAIEIYDHGRYFTVTGNAISEIGVENCSAEVERLYSVLAGSSSAAVPHQRRVVPERFDAGTRHPNLLHLCGSLWAKGLSDAAVLAALLAENQEKCNPPKPEKEIRDIIKWFEGKPKGQPISSYAIPATPVVVPAVDTAPSVYVLPTDEPTKTAPNDLARVILRDHRVVVYKDLLYEYDGRRWKRIKDGVLAQYALAIDSHDHTKSARRSETVKYVLDAARNDEIEWRRLADLEIPCRNGVVNIDTCDIRPHRPEDYLESVIEHDYDAGQHPHRWISTLERWFRGDQDASAKIDALQEFFGYCLLPHARFKKALFLYGESDTGKSQVPLILKALVGMENVCTLNTDQMADERKRAQIVGKMVNLMTELPMDAMISDGGFKQLVSTGDPISIDPKYVEPFTYVPFCKHVICTNNLPEIRDQTKATYNRLLLVKFNNVIPRHEQDDQLIDKLTAEIQGILAWAVEGAARLVQNRGKFTAIEESDAAVVEYRQSQNPVFEFVSENCSRFNITRDGPEMSEDWYVSVTEFRERFCSYLKKPIDPRAMRRMLESAGLAVKQHKLEIPLKGKRNLNCIAGIQWRRD